MGLCCRRNLPSKYIPPAVQPPAPVAPSPAATTCDVGVKERDRMLRKEQNEAGVLSETKYIRTRVALPRDYRTVPWRIGGKYPLSESYLPCSCFSTTRLRFSDTIPRCTPLTLPMYQLQQDLCLGVSYRSRCKLLITMMRR
jgi:hypothetical protein